MLTRKQLFEKNYSKRNVNLLHYNTANICSKLYMFFHLYMYSSLNIILRLMFNQWYIKYMYVRKMFIKVDKSSSGGSRGGHNRRAPLLNYDRLNFVAFPFVSECFKIRLREHERASKKTSRASRAFKAYLYPKIFEI